MKSKRLQCYIPICFSLPITLFLSGKIVPIPFGTHQGGVIAAVGVGVILLIGLAVIMVIKKVEGRRSR